MADFSAVGGSALSGAASGAAIGSVIPGVGTAIGAGVGALVGGGSALLGGDGGAAKEQENNQKRQAAATQRLREETGNTKFVANEALSLLAQSQGLQPGPFQPDFFTKVHKDQRKGLTGSFLPGREPGGAGDPLGLESSNTFIDRFKNSPLFRLTFQNALDEGTQAIERRASAGGRNNSGQTILEIAKRAGQLGNDTFSQFQNSLFKTAGLGQPASSLQSQTDLGAGNLATRTGADQQNLALARQLGTQSSFTDATKTLGQLATTGAFGGGGTSLGGLTASGGGLF